MKTFSNGKNILWSIIILIALLCIFIGLSKDAGIKYTLLTRYSKVNTITPINVKSSVYETSPSLKKKDTPRSTAGKTITTTAGKTTTTDAGKPTTSTACNLKNANFRKMFKTYGLQNTPSSMKSGISNPECKPDLGFMEPPGPVTALASFPGAGNTWARHLIQQFTGYFTGSVYGEQCLGDQGFLFRPVKNGSVIAVKTHGKSNKLFSRAVVLFRSLDDNILGDARWRCGHKYGDCKVGIFKDKSWSQYVYCRIKAWKKMYSLWLLSKKPLYVLRYENLKENMVDEMMKVTAFLGFTPSKQRIRCVLQDQEGGFKRKSRTDTKTAYTNDMRAEINKTMAYINHLINDVEKKNSANRS